MAREDFTYLLVKKKTKDDLTKMKYTLQAKHGTAITWDDFFEEVKRQMKI